MAVTWSLITGGSLSVKGVMSASDAAPAAGALDGQLLANVGGFTLYAECQVGETFTGSGTFTGYIWDPVVDWALAPDLTVTVPVAAAGSRRIAFTGWTVANPRGRVAHIANSVGVTGGTITLYYVCTMLRGYQA